MALRGSSNNDDDSGDLPDSPDAGTVTSRVPKTERILNLIAFLLKSREPVSVETVLSKVRGYDDEALRDSLMRRFERDKKVLREMGVPIRFCPAASGTEGYMIPRDSYYLEEIELPAHCNALVRAIAAASSRSEKGRMHDDLRSALLKLGFDAGDPAALVIAESDPKNRPVLDLKMSSSEGNHLEALMEAAVARRRVRFRYYTIGRDETMSREVDPYGLGFAGQAWSRGAWYLVGHCHLRNDLRVFKVDRIQGAIELANSKQNEAEFDIPKGFRVSEHISRPLWEHQEISAAFRAGEKAQKALKAVVRVDTTALTEIVQLVPDVSRESQPDGTSLLNFKVNSRRHFLRFLMRYLGHIEIVAPDELKADFTTLAKEIVGRYGDGA